MYLNANGVKNGVKYQKQEISISIFIGSYTVCDCVVDIVEDNFG